MLNIESVINTSQLSIGELYDKLYCLPKDTIVMLGKDLYFDAKDSSAFGSYRGIYEECAIEPTSNKDAEKYSTVETLLKTLDDAIEVGEMWGYKGGEYEVTDDTLVNVAYYGCTGSRVIDVVIIDERAYIVTDDKRW